MSENNDFIKIDEDKVLAIHNIKKNEIFEIIDEEKVRKLKKELNDSFLDKISKGIKANKSKSEMSKEWDRESKNICHRFDKIVDNIRGRRYAKVIEYKDKGGEILLKLKFLQSKEYKSQIPKLAESIASKLSKNDIIKLMEDVLLDENPELVNRISKVMKEKKDTKVVSRPGCFNIQIGDEELSIR